MFFSILTNGNKITVSFLSNAITKTFFFCVHYKKNEKKKIRSVAPFIHISERTSDMSEQEADAFLFDSITSNIRPKIFLKLSPNGHIFVDWSHLPRHENVRQCVIHYKSLNNNRVK